MNEIGNYILQAVNTIVEKKLGRLRYDKTCKSVILGKNEDGTYQVQYFGQSYNACNTIGVELCVGQPVWIKLPCGELSNIHICGTVR